MAQQFVTVIPLEGSEFQNSDGGSKVFSFAVPPSSAPNQNWYRPSVGCGGNQSNSTANCNFTYGGSYIRLGVPISDADNSPDFADLLVGGRTISHTLVPVQPFGFPAIYHLYDFRLVLLGFDQPSGGLSAKYNCDGTVTLTAAVAWAASYTIDHGVGTTGVSPTSYGQNAQFPGYDYRKFTAPVITADTTYTLTVTGMDGSVLVTTVTVAYPKATFSADITTISLNLKSTLTWGGTSDITSVTLYVNGTLLGNYPRNSSLAVQPLVTSTYTLVSHTGCGDVSLSITITVAPTVNNSRALFAALVTNSFCSPSLTGVPSPPKSLSSLSLTQDATRRPAVGGGASSVIGYVSKDAGHTYLTTTIDASGTDASLLIDTRRNRFRVIYSKASALVQVAGEVRETFVLDAGGPVALAGMGGGAAPTGAYPVAVPHPADRDFTLMAYLSSGVLWSAGSYDGGVSWRTQAAVAGGLDFTPTGRAALAMVGESAFIAYAAGSSLYAAAGADRGNAWAAPVLAATGGPYTGLSLLASQGRLYLLAFTVPATGGTPAPVLFVSPDLGATWAQVTSTFPAITPPSGIGVVPTTGTLRLGLTHTSGDDGHTWIAA